jgi:hypothetical protein
MPSYELPKSPDDDPNKAFFFPDLEEMNDNRAQPEDVRIENLSGEAYSDGKRVRVNLEFTPFKVRPHADIVLLDPLGEPATSISIIEPMSWKLEFTLHLRKARQDGSYKLVARLFYPPRDEEDPKLFRLDIPVEDTDFKEFSFEIPEGDKA